MLSLVVGDDGSPYGIRVAKSLGVGLHEAGDCRGQAMEV